MPTSAALIRSVRRPIAAGVLWVCNHVLGPVIGQHCPACGGRTLRRRSGALHPGLVKDWQLSPTWVDRFNAREFDICLACRATRRDQHIAAVLSEWLAQQWGVPPRDLSETAKDPRFHAMDVAEINSIGRLHEVIGQHPRLRYSEYGSKNPNVPHENILALSYPDHSFDLVLTSETLEHIPDFDGALREIHRVLRPGGTHFFTIPVVWDREQTVQRATIEGGRLIHLRSPSYHGTYEQALSDWTVFYEFGHDVVDRVRGLGFDVQVIQDADNPALAVILATKV